MFIVEYKTSTGNKSKSFTNRVEAELFANIVNGFVIESVV